MHRILRALAGRPRDFAGLLLVLLAAPACGGSFAASSPEDFGAFRIDVTNDLSPGVRVYLVPEDGGAEELLGDAPVEGTTTFRIEPETPDARFRLRAELPGREIVSDPFSVEGLQGVTWILGTNTLEREEVALQGIGAGSVPALGPATVAPGPGRAPGPPPVAAVH